MADAIHTGFWQYALEAACPEDHVYKLALFRETLEADAAYDPDLEIRGANYEAGGQVLKGRRVEVDENGEAWLKFDRFVLWSEADISCRSAMVYDATTGKPLRVIDFGRRVGVQGGLFEVKLPEKGVLSLGAQSEE